MENENLSKIIKKEDSPLKDLIVNYVGEKLNPDDDEITVENIVDVFSEDFPEFLLAVAEENWINGYSQALSDVEFVKKQQKEMKENEA